jgi:hypothetical protein
VPPQYRGHPLLNAGPFFTLPQRLLDKVVIRVGGDRFDAELLEMEYALSNVCGDHSSQIGFWGGQPINFLLLRPKSDPVDDSLAQAMTRWGKNQYEAWAISWLVRERLEWTADVHRGYCGWLMTNRAFREEHYQIFRIWAGEVAEHGVPNMGPVVRDAPAIPDAQLAEARMGRFLGDFEHFFIRWRLEGMPAPFVPQPMGVHLPVADLRPVLGHMRQGGTTFYIPDICPVPSRDKLREILEEALRNRNAPDYLAEWFEIVRSDNFAKNQIARYARVFELQHYIRALYARHAAALKRKKSALILALSEYLYKSEDSVERGLKFIADRLGPDWHFASA